MFEKLSDNLNLLMAKTRINSSELARQTGLPASSIKKIRNCDNPNPTLTTLIPLAKYFSISLSQLIGEEFLSISKENKFTNSENKFMYFVPLITWKEATHWPAKKNIVSLVATQNQYSNSAYALKVEEDNWQAFSIGTILLIDPNSKIEHRDFIIIYKENQETPTVRQVFYDDGQFYLKPMVEGYNITLLSEQHKCLGVIMESQRKFK